MRRILNLAEEQRSRPTKAPRLQAAYRCLECGHPFRTDKAAVRAMENGCPKCHGLDIDIAVDPSPATRRPA
jgi:Zn finger protein HypA/HybF involved in hydrogenase expression